MTKEEYENIKDEAEVYLLAYCLASDDFYYSGPYTRKIINNKIYSKWGLTNIKEAELDELSTVVGLYELTDDSAYFFESTLEVNDDSIGKFLSNIKNYIKESLETSDIKKCIKHFININDKTMNDIERA